MRAMVAVPGVDALSAMRAELAVPALLAMPAMMAMHAQPTERGDLDLILVGMAEGALSWGGGDVVRPGPPRTSTRLTTNGGGSRVG